MPEDQKIDAIALLKADHRKVESLFEDYEGSKGKASKQKLATTICTELLIHTTIEEEIFYPACQGHIEDDLEHEAYVEHDGAKTLIAELLGSTPEDPFFDAKVKVLSEQIKHHVQEEEKRSEGMFAQARAAGLDVDALGEKMAKRKKVLAGEFKKNGLPTPATRSYNGAKVGRSKPVAEAPKAA